MDAPNRASVLIMEPIWEPKIVGIIRRNAQGELERFDEAALDCDDSLNLVPVLSGFVILIGPVYESERPVLEALMKDL